MAYADECGYNFYDVCSYETRRRHEIDLQVERERKADEAKRREDAKYYQDKEPEDELRVYKYAQQSGIVIQPFNEQYCLVRELKVMTGKTLSGKEKLGATTVYKPAGAYYLVHVPVGQIFFTREYLEKVEAGAQLSRHKPEFGLPFLEQYLEYPIVEWRNNMLFACDERGVSIRGMAARGQRFVDTLVVYPYT